ncbi:MAG: amino acid-binding protein [Desulfobacterales bacterium CG23_combo_of_CG06-09_8_20_14_all_51_8]|nr:MAG: amino acid-binding protein [Desulfobacterales bacterium CG23_combo_of_CG06-09_8_20_14_all_51_8]
MKTQQISVFIENRSGRLAKITTALGNAGVNIRAMSLADTSDFGILRLIVNQTEKAINTLKDQGFTVMVSSVMAVAIPDTPGALGNLLSLLEHAGLNVEYMYAFITRNQNQAVNILRFDDIDKAIETLNESDITVLDEGALMTL